MSRGVHLPLRSCRARAILAMLSAGLALTPATPAAAIGDAGYFAFADRIAAALPARWDDGAGAYTSGGQLGQAARTNASMLVVHAVAARHGHIGPSRADARARRLVDQMTSGPMFLLPGPTPVHGRTVCWGRRLDTSERDHVSLDSQVAEALAAAWSARRQLHLSRDTVARISSAVDRCARHPGWRFPHMLVNQINWNAQLYASAAHVTGHRDLLRVDYRRFLARFAAGITRPLAGYRAPNLGPGYGFHYAPSQPASAGVNLDTPEYANIVLSTLGYYDQARHAGMSALGPRAIRLLRAWMTRVLTGSWTHGGYLNWDTGHGHHRWHSGQYWAFAQQGLLAIATAPRFWAQPEYGAWAKAQFDNALRLYERWGAEAGGGIAPQLPFDVRSDHRDRDLYAARIAANAKRAIELGLGSRRSQEPPPLFDYDVETGRLAVTTPRYSTAIVPENRGAFAYGGIELARLYGPGHRAAGNIGGEPPSTFGVVVRDPAGHEVLASQRARTYRGAVRVARSPRGRLTRRSARYPASPPAGAFRRLDTRGTVGRGGVRIRNTYRFRPAHIDVAWHVRCRGGCRRFTVDVLLPSWGALAAIDVTRPGRPALRLAGPGGADRHQLALAPAARIELGRGRRGGYAVTPLRCPRGTVMRTLTPGWQHTNPHPGPTLAIRLPAGDTGLALRLRPQGGPAA
jgi:hypothetical protein